MMDSPTTIAIGKLDISAEMSEGFKPTHTGGVQWVDLNCIDPNPWQPRIGEDNEHIKKLAESIATNNLLQIPSARRHPTHVGHYQLAFGHSRLAAFKFLRDATDQGTRFETMPLNIVELSDRQMADAAAAENVARKDLSAIEIARGIKRYIDDFGATQIEAGRVFGYTAQSSVSNLLRLLQLPEPVQQQVNEGKLPERYARELITLSRASPDAAVKVATQYQKAATDPKADEDDIKDSFDNYVAQAYDKHGVRMNDDATFDLAWPGKPIAVPTPKKDQPSEVPACKGCPFFVEGGNPYWHRCLRPACFKLKNEIWLQHALEAASAKLGIPIAGKDEKTASAYGNDGAILDEAQARQAIKAKDPTLRLEPFKKLSSYTYDGGEGSRERLFGYSVVMLTTTNSAAIKRAYVPKVEKTETSYERERREINERKDARVKLCKMAAPHMASTINVPGALLPILHEAVKGFMNDNDKKTWAARSDADRKTDILVSLIKRATDAEAWDNKDGAEKQIQKIHDLAGDMNIRLPQGWYHEATAVPVNGKAKKGKK
jgi:ParB family chromosome partitioning protein